MFVCAHIYVYVNQGWAEFIHNVFCNIIQNVANVVVYKNQFQYRIYKNILLYVS